MAMSALAGSIYQILRIRVPGEDPTIFYGDLVDELGSLPPPNQGLQPHDRRLFAALGEVGRACRAAGLPALSSIVVAKESGVPGAGYYSDHHPQARSEEARFVAWRSEFNIAKTTTYPSDLA
jgi:hypothetical protein